MFSACNRRIRGALTGPIHPSLPEPIINTVSSVSLPLNPVAGGRVRLLNVLRDLPHVADLVELCFQSSLDVEGRRYVQQMRRAGSDRGFLAWAGRVVETASMPLSGFVAEEAGSIIGNVSIMYQTDRGRRLALLANIATHPDHRGRGIATLLTRQAIETARTKGCTELWLQVRDDNPVAIGIYRMLGFVDRARRSTYQAPNSRLEGGILEYDSAPELALSGVHREHWHAQREWLKELHPNELAWYGRWDWDRLAPDIGHLIRRLLAEMEVQQWAATLSGTLHATATWIGSLRAQEHVWLAAPATADDRAVTAVLARARQTLAGRGSIALEHPAGAHERAITAAGFNRQRTLIWMSAPGMQST